MLTTRKWISGLRKTRSGMKEKFARVFKNKRVFDHSLLEKLEEILLESDVGVDTTDRLMDCIQDLLAKSQNITEDTVKEVIKQQIVGFVSRPGEYVQREGDEIPHVILVIGVNGTGKTTTIGKLAARYKNEGRKVLLAGADTFRAAAGEQLEVWGKRAGAHHIRKATAADPAAVAYDALNAAIARKTDVLIIDTAGRLHTKTNLMEELKKIRRVLSKRMETAPHQILLVLDATTGQNGLSQAEMFLEAVGVTGIVLTKLDGTARGGIVVAIRQNLDIPVHWVGIGEGLDDLIPFDGEGFVEGMFG